MPTNKPAGAPVPADGKPYAFDILRVAMPRLWVVEGQTEPVLALEIFAGKYRGVIFAFTRFEVLNTVDANGMSPTKYETEVFQAPEGFQKDEAFDRYTTELLLAWLAHVQMHEYRTIRHVKPKGSIQ